MIGIRASLIHKGRAKAMTCTMLVNETKTSAQHGPGKVRRVAHAFDVVRTWMFSGPIWRFEVAARIILS